MLSVILAAYREFSARVSLLSTSGMSKPERVGRNIQDTLGRVTKSEILKRCPDISQVTVQRTLAELVSSGKIIKIAEAAIQNIRGIRRMNRWLQES